jgi:hypothetical protein
VEGDLTVIFIYVQTFNSPEANYEVSTNKEGKKKTSRIQKQDNSYNNNSIN